MSDKVVEKTKAAAGKMTWNTKMKIDGEMQAGTADTKMKADSFGEKIKEHTSEMKDKSNR